MQIQSGICIELNGDRSVFLMKNGDFVRGTPVGHPLPGEETSFYRFGKKPALHWQPVMAPAIAAAAVMALFMSVWIVPAEEAFSYVQVEINPGIEFGINAQYEVVSMRELNNDGHDLIHQLGDWKNDPLEDVLNRVFQVAVTEQTEQITITSVQEKSRKTAQSIKQIVLAVSSEVEADQTAIQMKEATKEQWRRSKDDLVPVGQLIEKAETLNIQKNSEAKGPSKEVEKVPILKENKPTTVKEMPNITQKEKRPKEKETPIEKKPAIQKETILPAVEKKKEHPSPRTEQQQKTPNQADDSSHKTKSIPPVKKQDKAKQPNPKPKKKPVEQKEQSGSQDEKARNSKTSGQQKKNEASAVRKEAPVETEKDQPKKTMAEEPRNEKELKKTENAPKQEKKKGNNKNE